MGGCTEGGYTFRQFRGGKERAGGRGGGRRGSKKSETVVTRRVRLDSRYIPCQL